MIQKIIVLKYCTSEVRLENKIQLIIKLSTRIG